MTWKWTDTRHRVERDADEGYARARQPGLLQRSLEAETERIRSARVVARALVEGEETKKVLSMVGAKIEIKGLAQAVSDARKAIAEAKAAPGALVAVVTALKADCEDLTGQVKQLHSDLLFEASQLGNGGPTSADLGEKSPGSGTGG